MYIYSYLLLYCLTHREKNCLQQGMIVDIALLLLVNLGDQWALSRPFARP